MTEIDPKILEAIGQPDTYGAWVVYDYDNGPYAIALYANAGGAAHAAAQQGYGRVGFWRYGTDFRTAVRDWEAPAQPWPPPPPERTAPAPNPVVPST